jgi:hypothetical protein
MAFSFKKIEDIDYISNSQNYLQYFYCQMDYWLRPQAHYAKKNSVKIIAGRRA